MRRVGAALLAVVIGNGASARAEIGFDAIFYRARPAFNYCYAFQGVVGYSLRPLDDANRITHDPKPVPCPALPPGPAAIATADCPNCQADCTSFVRKAWNAQNAKKDGTPDTVASLLHRDTPDACRAPREATAFTRIVDMGRPLEDVKKAVVDLRPGDDCENSHHTILLVAGRGGAQWNTWEAKGAARGILPLSVDLLGGFLSETTPDPCKVGLKGNGCWRAATARTGPPTLRLPANGAVVPNASEMVFRFERPDRFPAVADYLLWFRWDENEGTAEPPDVRHWVVRIPAFTERWSDVSVRLADFPNLSAGDDCGAGGPTGQTCPRDVVNADVMEIPVDRLIGATVVRPTHFKPEDEGPITEAWSEDLVPCIGQVANEPAVPSPRPAESVCTVALVPDGEKIVRTGITYHWRTRVERYGTAVAGGFRRRAAVGRCHLDPATHFETDDDCKDPQWSPDGTFKIRPLYTLTGSSDERTPFYVDEDLDVYLNGTRIYTDGNQSRGTRDPIQFEAKKGDTVRIVVRDTYGDCASLQPLFIIDNVDNHAPAVNGFSIDCGRPETDQGIVYDQSFTIPF